jgi:hypothetical protein
MRLRSQLLALGLLGSLLAAAAAAQSTTDAPLAQSSFATSTEGWLSITLPFPSALPPTVLGSFAPAWISSLGGYIRIADPDGSMPTGQVQYWSAPAKFLGFKSAAFGGSLEFDLANSLGTSSFVQEDILLLGGGLTLVHSMGAAPLPAFTHYSIPLSSSGWKVGGLAGPAATDAQMQAVLASIDTLYIRAEHKNGQDDQYLDEVVMLSGPSAGGPWTELGFGLAGLTGVPTLAGSGPLTAGSAGSLSLSNARPAAVAVLFLSFASTPTPFKGGTLVPVPSTLTLSLVSNGAGAIVLPFNWPAGIPALTQIAFQYAIQDAAAVKGVALSHAVLAITP